MAALSLTADERAELHASIAEYLLRHNFKCFETFCQEADVPRPIASDEGMLERKWVSIVRLQRQVLELEDEVEKLRRHGTSEMPNSVSSWCVRAPSMATLKGHRGGVTCLTAHATSGVLASGSEDGTAKLWDLERRTLLATVVSHVDAVLSVALNGERLLTCSADTTAKLWDGVLGTSPSVRAALMGHEDAVLSGIFVRRWCATASRDGDARIWDADGRCLYINRGLCNGWIRALAAASYDDNNGDQGDVVAGAGTSNVAIVWRLGLDGRFEDEIEIAGHSHQLEALAFAPNELQLATASRDATLRVWRIDIDARIAHPVAELLGHLSWVRAVCWQPCGNRLISAGDDRAIKVWDLANQRCLNSVDAAHSAFVAAIALNRPAALLASASADKHIKLWDLR